MIKLIHNRIFTGIITIILAVEIFLFSTIKTTAGSGSGLNLALIYHLGIFFMFSFFLYLTINHKNKSKTKYILLTLIISIIYAILDETHQLFVPGRVFSIKDILIDSLGSLSSIIILTKFNK
jgi:hypothetical protein